MAAGITPVRQAAVTITLCDPIRYRRVAAAWLMLFIALAVSIGPAWAEAPMRIESAVMGVEGSADEEPQEAQGTSVSLPIDSPVALLPGRKAMHWFEFSIRLDQAPGDSWMVAFYSSSSPELQINGVRLLSAPTDPAPRPNPRYVPLRFDVPPALLHSGDNRLRIGMEPVAGRLALSEVSMGPLSAMLPWYRHQFLIGSTGFKVASLAIAGIAHFFFVLWSCRRQDSIYGLFSLSGFLWIAAVAPLFIVPNADALSAVARAMAIFSAWFSASFVAAGLQLLDGDAHREVRKLWMGAGLASVLLFAIPATSVAWLSRIGTGLMLLATCVVLILALLRTRQASPEKVTVLALSSAAVLVGFASDAALTVGIRHWPAPRLSAYGLLFYVIVVGGWLVNRFIREREMLDQRKPVLEDEARRSEAALLARYAAAAELDRRYAAAAERERFLAEVHEGLGAHLRQSREWARSGQLTTSTAEGLLNAALNELRICIESSRPGAQDLLMMLGNLRYRLESRLRRAGISLEWDVGGDIPTEALSPANIADISRITYEVFTNAISHSGATRLSLRVSSRPSGVAIEIVDNGRGFDTSAIKSGNGLRKVQQLAARMRAELSISSTAGKTRLELLL